MHGNEFGKYLQSLRKQKGLTLIQLAEMAGVSNPYISQIEHGKKPSPKILKKLAKGLNVYYSDLLLKAGYEDLYNAERFREVHEEFDITPSETPLEDILEKFSGERSAEELMEYAKAARRILQDREQVDFYKSRTFDLGRLLEEETDLKFGDHWIDPHDKKKLLIFIKYILLEMELKEEG